MLDILGYFCPLQVGVLVCGHACISFIEKSKRTSVNK